MTDDRNGGFIATTWKPIDAVKITTNYIHTELYGIPDFGVPYYRPGARERAVSSSPARPAARSPTSARIGSNLYGFLNRDFFRTGQDIGTLNAEVQITPDLLVTNKFRDFALDPELRRHASGIAGHVANPTPPSRLARSPPIRRAVSRSPT